VKFELTDTGESIDMYGPEPLGFLILTAEGRFMVIETVRDRQPPPQTPSGFRTQVRSVPNPRGCRRGVAAGDHTVIASDIHDYGFPLDFCRDFLSETRAGPLQCSGDQPSLQIRREIRRSRAHAGTDRDHVTAAGFHGIHQAHHHS